MKLEFSQHIFEKIPQMSHFLKIRPLGAMLLQTDRRTDMTKLIVAFRNSANTLKTSILILIYGLQESGF